jgi:hypothetical protein
LNPHTLRYRNLNPEDAYRAVASGRERWLSGLVRYRSRRFGVPRDDSGTIAWWPGTDMAELS